MVMAAKTHKKHQWISPTSVLKCVSLKPKGTNNVLFQNPPASSSKHGTDFPFFSFFAAASLIQTVYSQDERDVFKYSQQFQVIDVNLKNATQISRELLGNMHFEVEISH